MDSPEGTNQNPDKKGANSCSYIKKSIGDSKLKIETNIS